MTTAERRLEGLTQELTARERAILVMQKWLREEEWDRSLGDRIPEEQKAEYDRIVNAVEDANEQIHSHLIIEQLWLFQVEIKLGWLQSVAAVTDRAGRLEAELKRRGLRVKRGAPGKRVREQKDVVMLDPLPRCERGLEWTMRQLWGKPVSEPEPPPRGEDLVSVLIRELKLGLETRAGDLRAWRIVLGELRQAFDGYNATHVSVERDLSMLEDHIETLVGEARHFVQFELPLPTEEMVSVAREYVRLDDIRGLAPKPNATGQAWESDYAKKQREEANATWRQQLDAERAKREGDDTDVFMLGVER